MIGFVFVDQAMNYISCTYIIIVSYLKRLPGKESPNDVTENSRFGDRDDVHSTCVLAQHRHGIFVQNTFVEGTDDDLVMFRKMGDLVKCP